MSAKRNLAEWEKEGMFEYRYRSGRVARNLWKYIPENIMSGVDDVCTDSDGYWIYLSDGWTSRDGGSDCGTIHAYTIEDLIEDIRTISKQ